jgi:hypothetical protein
MICWPCIPARLAYTPVLLKDFQAQRQSYSADETEDIKWGVINSIGWMPVFSSDPLHVMMTKSLNHNKKPGAWDQQGIHNFPRRQQWQWQEQPWFFTFIRNFKLGDSFSLSSGRGKCGDKHLHRHFWGHFCRRDQGLRRRFLRHEEFGDFPQIIFSQRIMSWARYFIFRDVLFLISSGLGHIIYRSTWVKRVHQP